MAYTICVTGLRGIPDVMGGVETHAEHLYDRLTAHAPDCRFIILGRSPYIGSRPYAYRTTTIAPIWTLKNKYAETILHTFLSIFYARFALRADAIHIHAIGPSLLAPLARLLGLKVLATHHGHDYHRLKWSGLARTALRLGEALMVRTAHHVICVSAASARTLRETYPARADAISYIPNGAPAPGSAPACPDLLRRFGIDDEPFILAVGRLVPEKGFHDLLAAFRRSTARYKLVIVGNSDHEDAYSGALQQQASPRVVFTGRLTREQVLYLYTRAALFVLPSYHEGHPIVALEAMASGTPVLLSDIEPHLGLELPSRHYFALGDTAELAARLSNANFDALRIDVPDFVERFDWENIATATARILRSRIVGQTP